MPFVLTTLVLLLPNISATYSNTPTVNPSGDYPSIIPATNPGDYPSIIPTTNPNPNVTGGDSPSIIPSTNPEPVLTDGDYPSTTKPKVAIGSQGKTRACLVVSDRLP